MNHYVTNKKGESEGSPFYSDTHLFNSLPVYFSPYENETTLCWIFRLAHANCLSPHALFNVEKIHRHLWSSDNLYGNSAHQLINPDNWDEGMYPIPLKILQFLGMDHSTHSYFDPRHRYCPACISEQEEVHELYEWTFPWSRHCLVHHIPLLDNCRHCKTPSPIFNPDYGVHYQKTWGHCHACGEALIAENVFETTTAHEKYRKFIFPYVSKVNQLIKQAHDENCDHLFISMLLLISFKLKYANKRPYQQIWAFETLVDNGIDPCDFVCCPKPEVLKTLGFPTSIPYEAAIAMTFYLWIHRQGVFLQLIDEEWLPSILPIPETKVWTHIFIAKDHFPSDLYIALRDIEEAPYTSEQLFGGKGKSGRLLSVLSLYENGLQWDYFLETMALIRKHSMDYNVKEKEKIISIFKGTICADKFYQAASENTLFPSP